MRNLYGLVLAVALGLGAKAQAQFANKSLGLEVGLLDLGGLSSGYNKLAIPLALNGSLYLESHWELTAHLGGLFYQLPAGPKPNRAALDGAIGVRYLFLEETFRPYIGFGITPLWLVGASASADGASTGLAVDAPLYLGLYASAGMEYFVGTSVSLGLKLQYSEYASLNDGFKFSVGAVGYVAAYF